MTDAVSNSPGDAIADHVAALSHDAASLARSELEELRREMATTVRRAAESGALLAASAACGALALGASGVLVVRVLDKVLPRTVSAFVATGAFGAATVAFGVKGVEKVRAAIAEPVN